MARLSQSRGGGAGRPGSGGITLIGATLGLPGRKRRPGTTTDIIVRHIRARGVHNIACPGQAGDCLNIYRARRAIVDHCSFTGSCDGTVDVICTSELTFQWCTIEEPALWGQGGHQHDEGNHNLAFISSYGAEGVSFHHNPVAHSAGRNPLITHGPAEVRNNVVYNFGTGFTGGGRDRGGDFNIVGNYFRRGPSRRNIAPFYGMGGAQRFHCRDNIIDLGTTTKAIDDPWRELPPLPGVSATAAARDSPGQSPSPSSARPTRPGMPTGWCRPGPVRGPGSGTRTWSGPRGRRTGVASGVGFFATVMAFSVAAAPALRPHRQTARASRAPLWKEGFSFMVPQAPRREEQGNGR